MVLIFQPEVEQQTKKYPFREVCKSRILLIRLLNCSFCWITCAFVFYGLTLNSVAVSGNIYINYIFVALVEVPGYFCTYLMLDRFGRRFSLCSSLLLSGTACFAFIFIPAGRNKSFYLFLWKILKSSGNELEARMRHRSDDSLYFHQIVLISYTKNRMNFFGHLLLSIYMGNDSNFLQNIWKKSISFNFCFQLKLGGDWQRSW